MREETFIFGPFEFEPMRSALRIDGRTVQLGNRAMEVLAILVENAGSLVRHEEILQRVWPTTFVSDSNLRVHIRSLRRALCDEIGCERYILNVPGRGYRFVAPVQVRSLKAEHEALLDRTSPSRSRHAMRPLIQLPKRRFRECAVLVVRGRRRIALAEALIGPRTGVPRNGHRHLGRECLCKPRYSRTFRVVTDQFRLIGNHWKPATRRL